MRFEGKNIEIRALDNLKEKKGIDKVSSDSKYFELFLKLKEKVPELREGFKKDINIFIEGLNAKYDIEKINKIIDILPVNFSELDLEFKSENDDLQDIAGYSVKYIDFYLSDLLNVDNFKHFFYHEFLHALSTNINRVIYSVEGEFFKKYIAPQSTGFKFRGLNTKRFEWLNEAVTEQLAISLTKTEKSESYVKERQLLDLLNKKKKEGSRLDFDLLIKIYFRHIQKREESDSSEVDDWRNFSKEVDDAFGERFLVKLDLYIEENGIDKALGVISSWTDGEPNIDDLIIKKDNIKQTLSFDYVNDDDL